MSKKTQHVTQTFGNKPFPADNGAIYQNYTPAQTHTVESTSIKLKKNPQWIGTIQAELYKTANNIPTGEPLIKSRVLTDKDIGQTYRYIEFPFGENKIILESGVEYSFVYKMLSTNGVDAGLSVLMKEIVGASGCKHEKMVFHQWITLPLSGVIPVMKCEKCGKFEFTGADERDFKFLGHHELIINLEKEVSA